MLSELYNLDRATGAGILPLIIKDLSRSTMFFAPQAWVVNLPSFDMGRTLDSVDWELDTGIVSEPVLGGNESASQLL